MPQINETHIFEGEINERGRAVGFHHRASGQDPPGARVVRIVDPPNAQGVYRAAVEIFNSDTNQWIWKGPLSSFFPDAWSPDEALSEIRTAFYNRIVTRGRFWEGITDAGLRIGGYLDDAGDINTAFPIY